MHSARMPPGNSFLWENVMELDVSTPCPSCGKVTLKVKKVLKAKPIGSFSLSGQMMKFSAKETWKLRCTNDECDWNGEGSLNE